MPCPDAKSLDIAAEFALQILKNQDHEKNPTVITTLYWQRYAGGRAFYAEAH